ncbi:MAG TPA: MASE1 domain-containing protein [Blastocatellia bacterium]|nr:MASE1 domain-containing protein [Blastocatellia bacterium]
MRSIKSNDKARTIKSLPPRGRASWREAIRRVLPPARTILNLLLFSTAFYLAYIYGMLFPQAKSAPFWAPDAVLLCALLLTARRNWWLYLLAPIPIRFLVAVPPDMPAWFLPAVYINDSLKAIISAALLRRLNHGSLQLKGMQELAKFFAVAVLGVPILSAFAGAATRFAIGDDFWSAWQRWFLGNALANLLLTPMILYWIKGGFSALRSAGVKRWIEGSLLLMGLILVGLRAFNDAGSQGHSPVLIYLPFPLLLYTAVRFGPRGISSALSLITVFAIWSAELGRGPFFAQAPGGAVLTLQLFLCVISLPLFCLSVLLQERQRVGKALRESEARYRSVVESQTELICRYLPDTTLTFVNDAYCRHFGKTWEDLIGMKFLELIPEDSRDGVRGQVESLIQRPRTESNEHEVLLPDGRIGWQQWIDHAIRDAGGKIVEFQAVGRDITERKRAEQSLRESDEALRKSYARIEDLAGRLIAAQEDERRYIARELHDDLNQQVAALAIGISRIKRQFPGIDSGVREQLARLREKTEQLSERIRQLSHELHSSVLQHVGLPAALNSYCAEFSERQGIAVALDIQDGLGALPSDVALCLYRVTQESLRNIARHSGARSAIVALTGVNDAIELRVADQGVGFDPGQAREFRGLGLVSMEERVKLLRGSFVLTTRPGAGTELRAQIPLRREHESTKSIVG